MRKVSFFATVIILITSAALVMAGGHFGKSSMEPRMGGCKMGMGAGMAGCMEPGMGGCKMGGCMGAKMARCMEPGMGGCKMGMGAGMAGCMEPGMGGCKMGMGPGKSGCMGAGMAGCMEPRKGGCMGAGMSRCMEPGMGGCKMGAEKSERMGKMGIGFDMSILSNLDLTTEQTEGIQSLHESLKKDVTSLRTQIFEKKREMKALWGQLVLNVEEIKAKQAEIHELKAKIRGKATDFRLAVRGTLTMDQVAKLILQKDSPPCQQKGRGQDYGKGCPVAR